MSVTIRTKRQKQNKAFTDLVMLLWKLHVTKYINIPMVSNVRHLSKFEWDYFERERERVIKRQGPRKA